MQHTSNRRTMEFMSNDVLFALLGYTFGGGGPEFGLPDLRKIGLPTGMQYCIATSGVYPPH